MAALPAAEIAIPAPSPGNPIANAAAIAMPTLSNCPVVVAVWFCTVLIVNAAATPMRGRSTSGSITSNNSLVFKLRHSINIAHNKLSY